MTTLKDGITLEIRDGEIISVNNGLTKISRNEGIKLRYLSDFAKLQGVSLTDVGIAIDIWEDLFGIIMILVNWRDLGIPVIMKPDELRNPEPLAP